MSASEEDIGLTLSSKPIVFYISLFYFKNFNKISYTWILGILSTYFSGSISTNKIKFTWVDKSF